jgi:hypothetical protein
VMPNLILISTLQINSFLFVLTCLRWSHRPKRAVRSVGIFESESSTSQRIKSPLFPTGRRLPCLLLLPLLSYCRCYCCRHSLPCGCYLPHLLFVLPTRRLHRQRRPTPTAAPTAKIVLKILRRTTRSFIPVGPANLNHLQSLPSPSLNRPTRFPSACRCV